VIKRVSTRNGNGNNGSNKTSKEIKGKLEKFNKPKYLELFKHHKK